MELPGDATSDRNECTLIIVDDDSAIRMAVRDVLNDSPAQVIGEAENGPAGIQLAEQLHPDIILLDVSMPQMNGFTVCRELRKLMPQAAIIFLSEHTQRAYVEEALEMGAKGYLMKRKASRDLLDAIRTVLSGDIFISASIAGVSS